MPIYMDRHYIEGVTHQDVADAHLKDLQLESQYDIKLLTYWFDEERSTTFCLVNAPNEQAIRDLHNDAHGSIPNEIIEVDPMTVEAFLGRVKDPAPSEEESGAGGNVLVDSAFRTIMFTDLMDSTAMTTRLGDQKAMHFIRLHNTLTRDALKAHNGSEVKHTGDGFMVSFSSVYDALECAISIQNSFSLYNRKNPEATMHVRIGLSAGEPVEEDQDLFGATVQLAARLCEHAEPDRILVAQVVCDQCKHREFPFSDCLEIMPKGFDRPVRTYEVKWQGA